jgi:hypothetical protein
MTSLPEIIADAKRQLQRLKRDAPWLLREYMELQVATDALREAEARYKKARQQWEGVGK